MKIINNLSLINVDFIGLVTWLGVKGVLKKRILKAQKLFKGYNFETKIVNVL